MGRPIADRCQRFGQPRIAAGLLVKGAGMKQQDPEGCHAAQALDIVVHGRGVSGADDKLKSRACRIDVSVAPSSPRRQPSPPR